MRLSLSGIAAALAILGLSMASPALAACLSGGDESMINALLNAPGARAVLCPRAVFNLSAPVVLSAARQEITTEGEPTGEARAILRVTGDTLATAITSRASDIAVRNIIVDGARPKLGRIAKGGGLIDLGGSVSGVSVDHIRAFDPRGWSSLHIFEGARDCNGAHVTNSEFGPAGTPDHAWADGISFACRNGLVAHNTIIDASDGGIVIFESPGTVVEDNTVLTRTNTLLGGINLVDYRPFDGDYSGTIVRHNRIEAQGGFIKVAIAIGPGAWGMGHGEVNRGGTVTDNLIKGDAIGYGITIDGASDFTVLGNRVEGHLGGVLGERCDKGEAAPGTPFVRDIATSLGTYQSAFVNGHVRYSICVARGAH